MGVGGWVEAVEWWWKGGGRVVEGGGRVEVEANGRAWKGGGGTRAVVEVRRWRRWERGGIAEVEARKGVLEEGRKRRTGVGGDWWRAGIVVNERRWWREPRWMSGGGGET